MRSGLILAVILVLAVIGAFAFGLIDINQTKETRLPQITGGQAPAFDVDTAKVAVGTKTTTVDVPKVGTEKKAIEVPTLDVKKAN